MSIPIVLTIAGTDPSGGAGIQADIKTISATASYAASIITALVAQNTQGVQAKQEITSDFLIAQFESVFNDLCIDAVKIGMLNDRRISVIVAEEIAKRKPQKVVFDPVMVAKSGDSLLSADALDLIKKILLPNIFLLTPNLDEAELILNKKITTLLEMQLAAETIAKDFNINVLLKGGHFKSQESSDILYQIKENSFKWYTTKRINTNNTHGTGCTLSSAIASYLAHNYTLEVAIQNAKNYLTNAILKSSTNKIGKGNGPLIHFF